MKIKGWMIASVVGAVLLGWLMLGGGSSGVPVETTAVRRGPISQYVDEQAKTRLPKVHLVTMPQAGLVEEIEIAERASVKKNQPVATMVPVDLKHTVDQARAVVARLEADIQENKDSSLEMTAKKQMQLLAQSAALMANASDTQVKAAKARRDYSNSNFVRVSDLSRSGGKTQDDVDRATREKIEADENLAQNDFTYKSSVLMKAVADLGPLFIDQFLERKKLQLASLEQQKSEAEAKLNKVLVEQQRGTLYSPIDGVVLERAESNQRYLPAGTVLLKIGDLDELEIEADVLSQDIPGIKADAIDPATGAVLTTGSKVEIYGPAIGRPLGQGAIGYVKKIYPAGFTKVSSLGVEQQRVKVLVRFAPGVLKPIRDQNEIGVDYRVRVRIIVAERDQVLVIPRSAMFRGTDGGWQVFAVRGGKAEIVPVEIGLWNDEFAEVTAGLTAEDQVIMSPESTLTDGVRVSAKQRK